MCNDYGNHIPYSGNAEAFSHLKLPLLVQGNGPDLTPRDAIRIRDTAPIILRTKDGVELTERAWAPRAANKKPIFNFRSEKRKFQKSTRCLIPSSHFFEFTAPVLENYGHTRSLVLMVIQAGQQAARTAATALSQAFWARSIKLSSPLTWLP